MLWLIGSNFQTQGIGCFKQASPRDPWKPGSISHAMAQANQAQNLHSEPPQPAPNELVEAACKMAGEWASELNNQMFQNLLVSLLTAVTPRKPMSWLFLSSQRKRLSLQNYSWHEGVGPPSVKPHGRQTTKVCELCDKCFSRENNPRVHMRCYTS